ncbi:phasin family protein [Acidisphaera sp. S103]|uniref:phasin family protein n=1 Tax=Acidisphaera sp. S103 TaxID=1747223 RepID=UPI00131B1961|nr:phasin family protein [Acidisphaera sp. S103]
MSETSRTAETTKRAAEQTTRSSQAAMEAAGKATKDAIHETSHAAQNGAERARDVSHTITETVMETADVAADLSSRAAEQGREVLLMGVRTAAGAGSRVADIGFGRGHHLLASATHAMDIYRDASERSAERVQALFSSYLTFGRGLQAMQHAWLEIADQTIENAAHKPQDLLRCKNMVEVAEVQRDLYIGAINHALESTTRLLEMAGRTVHDAARPLQSDHH